jgi:putative flippase GtrA
MTAVETYILRWLPRGFEQIYRHHSDVFRFIIIGGLATVAHYIIALSVHHILGAPPLWANFIAFCGAFNVTYIGNYFWVFGANTAHKKSLPKSLIVSVTGLCLSQFIVWGLTEKLGAPFHLTLIIAVMFVPLVTFTLNRFWVFER